MIYVPYRRHVGQSCIQGRQLAGQGSFTVSSLLSPAQDLHPRVYEMHGLVTLI